MKWGRVSAEHTGIQQCQEAGAQAEACDSCRDAGAVHTRTAGREQDPEEGHHQGHTAQEPASAVLTHGQKPDGTESRTRGGGRSSHQQQFHYYMKESNWRGGICKGAVVGSRRLKLEWGESPRAWAHSPVAPQPCGTGEGCGGATRACDCRKRKTPGKVLAGLTTFTQVHKASGRGLGVGQPRPYLSIESDQVRPHSPLSSLWDTRLQRPWKPRDAPQETPYWSYIKNWTIRGLMRCTLWEWGQLGCQEESSQSSLPGETNHLAQMLLTPAPFTPAAAQLGRAHGSAATKIEWVSLSLCLKWKILVSLDLVLLTSLPSGKGFFHNANTLKSPANGRMESTGCFGLRCQNSVALKYS